MPELLFIRWNASPEIFEIGSFALRWYGLLFASGFYIGFHIMTYIFKTEGKKPEDVDSLTIYMLLATVIGARLGHCLFYEPDYYLSNPIEILKVWEGGLASHGATIGILVALFLYSRKHPDQSWFWILDRIVITVSLAGAFIRTGNLMNSEIYGIETNMPWGFIFEAHGETVPKHPTQIYEALFCLFLFALTFLLWKKRRNSLPVGFIFSLFVTLLFTFRFFVEFIKNPQVEFETTMALNMGQWLSIPLIVAGIVLMLWLNKYRKPNVVG